MNLPASSTVVLSSKAAGSVSSSKDLGLDQAVGGESFKVLHDMTVNL